MNEAEIFGTCSRFRWYRFRSRIMNFKREAETDLRAQKQVMHYRNMDLHIIRIGVVTSVLNYFSSTQLMFRSQVSMLN